MLEAPCWRLQAGVGSTHHHGPGRQLHHLHRDELVVVEGDDVGLGAAQRAGRVVAQLAVGQVLHVCGASLRPTNLCRAGRMVAASRSADAVGTLLCPLLWGGQERCCDSEPADLWLQSGQNSGKPPGSTSHRQSLVKCLNIYTVYDKSKGFARQL